LPDVPAPPKAVLADSRGVLWLATSGGGLGRFYNGEVSYFRERDGLASDRALAIAETKDGSIWIGTNDGLTQFSDTLFPTYSVSEGLVTDAALAVAAAPDGSVWIGTANGVSRYKDGAFKNFGSMGGDGFSSRWVKRIFA